MNGADELKILKLAAGEWPGVDCLLGEQLPRYTSRREIHEIFIKTGLMTMESVEANSCPRGSNYKYVLLTEGAKRLKQLKKEAGEEETVFTVF